MTFFGKLLVLINVALSVVLVTVALGLYTQRVDWSGNPSASPPTKGEVKKLQEKLQGSGGWGLNNELSQAEKHYLTVRTDLAREEADRPQKQKWYSAQMATVQPGASNAVKDIVYNQGLPVYDPQGLPEMKDAKDRTGAPLMGIDFYTGKLNSKDNEIKADSKSFDAAAGSDADLTGKIGMVGGLRHQIEAEVYKAKQIKEQVDYLEEVRNNVFLEKELLQKRREQLEARRQQLENARKAQENR